jgi:hypothetical protein
MWHLAQQRLEACGVLRSHLDDQAAERLGEQRYIGAGIRSRARQYVQIYLGPKLAADAHLGQRHAQPTLRAVMAGSNQARADRPVQRA